MMNWWPWPCYSAGTQFKDSKANAKFQPSNSKKVKNKKRRNRKK